MSGLAMSVYHHMGYPYTSTASQTAAGPNLVSVTSASGAGCGCETGRVVATDPVTGAAICSCQYDASPSRLSVSTHLNVNAYPRLAAPAPGSALHYSAAYAGGDPQSAYPSIGVDAAYFGSLGSAYGLKDSTAADMGVYGGIGTAAGYGYNPYDPSLYGYGAPYDLAARRKNATREATGTLKAWMNEHKKNPYPTKGEKIMLAIITKMTLTQISTWFANARRRLKKENKMTWTPKNRVDSDDEDAKDAESEDKDDSSEKDDTDKDASMNSSEAGTMSPGSDNAGLKSESRLSTCSSDTIKPRDSVADPLKPKIWSLADTAVCKTPPQGATWCGPQEARLTCGDTDRTTFPLPPTIGSRHLHRFAPYSRQSSAVQEQPLWNTPKDENNVKLDNYPYALNFNTERLSNVTEPYDNQTLFDNTKVYNLEKSYNATESDVRRATSVYGTAGTVTPPQTPPSAAPGTQISQAQGSGDVPGYTATYPGVLSALERRTDVYGMHQYWRQ